MSQLTQVQAVIAVVAAYALENNIEFTQGSTDARSFINEEQIVSFTDLITSQIENGDVVFSENAKQKYSTLDKVKGYVKGMIKNHLNRSLKLNGGNPYVPANPGSRTGQSNPEVKNLRACINKLKSEGASEEVVAQFENALSLKIEEIKESKKPQVEIDSSLLSPELADLLDG